MYRMMHCLYRVCSYFEGEKQQLIHVASSGLQLLTYLICVLTMNDKGNIWIHINSSNQYIIEIICKVCVVSTCAGIQLLGYSMLYLE